MANAFKGGNKFAAAGVAMIVIQPVAIATLFDRVAAGDDVDHQPPLGQTLEAGGLVRGKRGGDKTGTERDDKFQSFGVLADGHGG